MTKPDQRVGAQEPCVSDLSTNLGEMRQLARSSERRAKEGRTLALLSDTPQACIKGRIQPAVWLTLVVARASWQSARTLRVERGA